MRPASTSVFPAAPRLAGAFLAVLVGTLAAPAAAPGADLLEVYSLAAQSDPVFRQVAAAKRAVLEQRPQALAQLLPSLELNANTYSNDQDISAGFVVDGTGGDV